MPEGYIKRNRRLYYVQTAQGLLECKAKGIFRKRRITLWRGPGNGGVRRGRKCDRTDCPAQKCVCAAAPLQTWMCCLWWPAPPSPCPAPLLDKLTAIAADKGAQPVLVFTKADLASAEELLAAYERSALPVIRGGLCYGEGLEQVKDRSGEGCSLLRQFRVGKAPC